MMRVFLKLIRFSNLIIVACTMYAVRFCFFSIGGKIIEDTFNERILFSTLVFSTLLIAASGNIINDYFDIKTDKINKPESWIVGNLIPKRKAILYHWIMTLTAFIMAILLSIYYKSFWYLFIHLFSINLLWLYSVYFKRTAFWGNFIVAFLTALVIVLTGIHFAISGTFTHSIPASIFEITSSIDNSIFSWKNIFLENGKFIWIFALFSFFLNLGREIIKDIEDIEGDKSIHAHTIPLKYGIKTAKLASITILLAVPIAYLFLLLNYKAAISFTEIMATLPVALAVGTTILAILLLVNSDSKKQFKKIDRLLKIAMILGVLTPFYWALF
jgi:4-hydroxybenzoate polyprenyltransferase